MFFATELPPIDDRTDQHSKARTYDIPRRFPCLAERERERERADISTVSRRHSRCLVPPWCVGRFDFRCRRLWMDRYPRTVVRKFVLRPSNVRRHHRENPTERTSHGLCGNCRSNMVARQTKQRRLIYSHAHTHESCIYMICLARLHSSYQN